MAPPDPRLRRPSVSAALRPGYAPSGPPIPAHMPSMHPPRRRAAAPAAAAGGGGSLSAGRVVSFAAHCAYMWLIGLFTACAFHRVLSYTTRSRKLAVLAARCFVLNGVVFLGSLAVVERFLAPIVAAAVDSQRAAALAQQAQHTPGSAYQGMDGFQVGAAWGGVHQRKKKGFDERDILQTHDRSLFYIVMVATLTNTAHATFISRCVPAPCARWRWMEANRAPRHNLDCARKKQEPNASDNFD